MLYLLGRIQIVELHQVKCCFLRRRKKMDYLKKSLSNQAKEPKNSTHMTPQGIWAWTHWWEVEGSDCYANLAPCKVFFFLFFLQNCFFKQISKFIWSMRGSKDDSYKNYICSINIGYSPARRSVLGKTVPEVLYTARGHRPRAVLKT